MLILRHLVGLIDIDEEFAPMLIPGPRSAAAREASMWGAILILRYIVGLMARFPEEAYRVDSLDTITKS